MSIQQIDDIAAHLTANNRDGTDPQRVEAAFVRGDSEFYKISGEWKEWDCEEAFLPAAPAPSWVSPSIFPAFKLEMERAYDKGETAGIRIGSVDVERKVKDVGRMIFGTVIEDALYGAIHSPGIAKRD